MHDDLWKAATHAALWLSVTGVAVFSVYSSPEAFPVAELACIKPADPRCGSCRVSRSPDGEQR